MTILHRAVSLLRPGQNFGIINEDDWNTIQMSDGSARPSDADIRAKLSEARQSLAMDVLREERNKKLAECDFRSLPDYPGADKDQWLSYRQALRDLPSTAEPDLNDQLQLTNVTFPAKPE
jgi:hypothetical protein